VAGIASCAGQVVVVAGVALIAVGDDAGRRHLVIANESPSRRSMTPGSSGEGRSNRVTVGAVGDGESGSSGGVYRIIRAGVVRLVAILVAAARWRFQIITTCRGRMALRALHGSVQAGQRETRVVVVEG